MSRRPVFNLTATLCAAALSLTPPLALGESVADSLSQEVRTIYERCRDAVVKIEASDQDGQSAEQVFFIHPNGMVLTSYSVGGEDSRGIVVVRGDQKYPARRLIADWRSGIAILKLEKTETPTSFLPLATSTAVAVATPVVTVAYPMDMPLTPNFGMISGFTVKDPTGISSSATFVQACRCNAAKAAHHC